MWLQPCVYSCTQLLSLDMHSCAQRYLKVMCTRLSGTSTERESYITPAFSEIPEKGDQIQIACTGACLYSCRGTALPTRVWTISDGPLHRDGIDM